MNTKELNKRAKKVFDLKAGDYVCDVIIGENGKVKVPMREFDNGDYVDFDYEPNMSERPEALDYLLGRRNDFSD